jgi:hypothetical protein
MIPAGTVERGAQDPDSDILPVAFLNEQDWVRPDLNWRNAPFTRIAVWHLGLRIDL